MKIRVVGHRVKSSGRAGAGSADDRFHHDRRDGFDACGRAGGAGADEPIDDPGDATAWFEIGDMAGVRHRDERGVGEACGDLLTMCVGGDGVEVARQPPNSRYTTRGPASTRRRPPPSSAGSTAPKAPKPSPDPASAWPSWTTSSPPTTAPSSPNPVPALASASACRRSRRRPARFVTGQTGRRDDPGRAGPRPLGGGRKAGVGLLCTCTNSGVTVLHRVNGAGRRGAVNSFHWVADGWPRSAVAGGARRGINDDSEDLW